MAHHQHLKMYHEVHSLDMFTDKCKKVIYVRKIRPLLELATASSGPCAVSPRGEWVPSSASRGGGGWAPLHRGSLRLPRAIPSPRPLRQATRVQREVRRTPGGPGGFAVSENNFQSQLVGSLSRTPNISSVHTAESSIFC